MMRQSDTDKKFGRLTPVTGETPEGDLGLGDKVARRAGTRLINADGSFNIKREGNALFAPYQALVEMSWTHFTIVTVLSYLFVNILFALGFYLIGVDQLSGVDTGRGTFYEWLHCFYFSVQTFTTVGYGEISPIGMAANTLAAFHALFGWIMLAFVTGLFYGRFSRPRRMIRFSTHALITSYREGISSLQFRIVNARDNSVINVRARVVLTWLEERERGYHRQFQPLQLEREYVPLFPLNWTIVHPITEESPLRSWSKEDYHRYHAELLVMVEGYDETFAQPIHIRNSYTHDELRWKLRFAPMYRERERMTELFLDRIDDLEEE